MAFQPIKEKIPNKNSSEINNPQQEVDLKLEEETNIENERGENQEPQENTDRETNEQSQ